VFGGLKTDKCCYSRKGPGSMPADIASAKKRGFWGREKGGGNYCARGGGSSKKGCYRFGIVGGRHSGAKKN